MTYKNENDTIRIKAYEENGKYYLIISKKIKYLAATRSGKTAIEEDIRTYKKEFNNKDQANNYFKAIKKNNPTLTKAEF